MLIKKWKFFVLIAIVVLTTIITFFSAKYGLRYMNWYAKSKGYPGLYEKTDNYSFVQAPDYITKNLKWEILTSDFEKDGDLPNWPDADKLYISHTKDTLWIRFTLHNNLDINEPMISLAFEDENGKNWYGTVKDFTYSDMITAGYYRNENNYYGYNFIADSKGSCSFLYDLESNSLFLGLPKNLILKFNNKRFVASVGLKGLWNDDFDSENLLVWDF